MYTFIRRLLVVAITMVTTVGLSAEEPAQNHIWIDAQLFSFRPDIGLASYRSHGGGGGSDSATLGLGVFQDNRRFQVEIKPVQRKSRLIAVVSIQPRSADTQTPSLVHEFDLSDLQPKSLDICSDDDGRVYRLNLMPKVVEPPKPVQLEVEKMQLESLSFPNSPIILNDLDYLGQLAMSSGTLADIEVPGLALIEFSLFQLTDSQPWGVLDTGVIQIAHPDGTTLKISNVRNGIHREILKGGPYKVWVRWKQPSMSIEEYREQMKEVIANLRERVAKGEISIPAERLERIEKELKSGRPRLSSNGLKAAKKHEIVEPE